MSADRSLPRGGEDHGSCPLRALVRRALRTYAVRADDRLTQVAHALVHRALPPETVLAVPA
ncbi:hypothetical protein AB0958_07355 [Streptomyces sp. NPDC006655]|uniref:hypothetical protein n=1 Tax=Streptomyces sp. NPDC006655 TaxID=3156898 RepID=UPI0034535D86